MPWCPVCRDEFRDGVFMCPDHGVALVDELPPLDEQLSSSAVPQAELGAFDIFAVPILVSLLEEHGIQAHSEAINQGPYRSLDSRRALVFVQADRTQDAQRITREELPERLRSIEAEVAADSAFAEAGDAGSPGGLPEEPFQGPDADEDVEEYEALPIGWMDLSVARAFLELCEESDIGADTEYPLDEPPPPWARADGRVRVHVEDLLVDEALELLATELPSRLAAAGIAAAEPLLEAES